MKNTPKRIIDAIPTDVVESVKELNKTIDRLVSMKPQLRRLSKIIADYDRRANPKILVVPKKSNWQK